MNKEIYSISGENLEGQEVEVFKAGFNSSNKPVVTVGSNEVSLDDVISTPAGGTAGQVLTKTASAAEWADINALPSGGTTGQVLTKTDTSSAWADIKALPEGGTTGQILTKTATASEWADAPNPVEANPTLAGGETVLTSIKIGESKYKIEGGGGFPEEANAGDAIIYNGSEWSKQDNYGYLIPAHEESLTWDGDPTGHYKIFDTYYQITENILSADSYEGKIVTITTTDESRNIAITSVRNYGSIILCFGETEEENPIELLLICTSNFYLDGTYYKKGTYFFSRDGGYYISKFTYPVAASISPINQKYIYGSGNAGDIIAYDGTNWTNQSDYGYTKPAYLMSTEWNGDTTGRAVFADDFYLVTNEAYDSENYAEGTVIINNNGTLVEKNFLLTEEESFLFIGYDMDEEYGELFILCTQDSDEYNIQKGLYFLKENGVFTQKLTYKHGKEVVPINSKYIYPTASNNSSMIYKNGEWAPSTGYASYTPATDNTITWDGESEGHETLNIEGEIFVKISSTSLTPDIASQINIKYTIIEDGETQIVDDILSLQSSISGGLYLYQTVNADLVVYSAPADVTIYGYNFTKGMWTMKLEEEGVSAFISEIPMSTPESYTQFNPKFIPLEFNQEITNKYAKNIKFGDDTYVVTSIEETNIPNRVVRSTNQKGELVWTPPFEFQALTTITGDGTKDQFYIKHDFGNKLVTHICKDSGGNEVTVTGTAHNNLIYSIKFTTPPASGATYIVELKPTKIIETMSIVVNEYDIVPMTSEEAEESGYVLEEV